MGALLAQDGTLEERSNQFHSSELRAVNWDKIGNIAQSGANIFSNIFGGSSCSDADKQQRAEVAAEIRRYLTPQDRQNLVQGMENNIAPTPEAMARFFMGGKDCKHKNVTPGDQRFLNRLPTLIQQRKQEAEKLPRLLYRSRLGQTTRSALLSATRGVLGWLFITIAAQPCIWL